MSAATINDAAFRLPGVYFLPASRPQPVALPPLDVAGFVGFALRGPLDVPVPIEDLSSFDAIFGGPLSVARGADGTPVAAYLRDAVAAFFSSGGRRCYTVRVAGANASASRFAIPGLIAFDPSGTPGRGELDASSPGSWGGALQLGTVLTAIPMRSDRFTLGSDGLTLVWDSRGAAASIETGDVLRLSFAGAPGLRWLFPIAQQSFGIPESPYSMLSASSVWMVRTSFGGSVPPPVSSLGRVQLSGTEMLTAKAQFLPAETGFSLSLSGPDSLSVARGDLLLLSLDDATRHVLTVGDIESRPGAGSLPAASVVLSATELLCIQSAPGAAPLPSGVSLQRVEALQMNLRIRSGGSSPQELDALGFNSGHPRLWTDIAIAESGSVAGGPAGSSGASQQQQSQTLAPGDATTLYGELFGSERADLDWTDPRLAVVLSALLAPPPAAAALYLPVGMDLIGSDADLVGPDPGWPGNDDLDIFDAEPFLDPYLISAASPGAPAVMPGILLATATDRYFLQNVRLQGIHSLMFIDEVALIAAPDAVQLGWSPGTPNTSIAAPATPPQSASPSAGFTDCTPPPTLLSVVPTAGPLSGEVVTLTGSGFQSSDPITVSFAGQAAAVQSVTDSTVICIAPTAQAAGPVSVAITTSAGTALLAAAYEYELVPTPPALPQLIDAADYDAGPLQTIHTAMVNVCSARADAVAILALPLSFETQDCIDWLQALRQNLGLPRHGSAYDDARDVADPSFACAYHPWLLVPAANAPAGALHAIPPDGAICGAIAAREIARQVWVAPANVPLPGVLDLQPGFSADDWAALFAQGINLVRDEAQDFRIMSACTLADDRSVRELSVRRMLIQLRKAMLKLGQDHVFDNNDAQLRQRVRTALEDLMRYMFALDAFSGSSQQTSYRIAVDVSVNTPSDVDQGRLIAQILVAPSQPMEFISVLLTRTGAGFLQATEG